MDGEILTNRVLLGPGPSNVNPRVTQAMLNGMLSHLDPEFWSITDQVCDMLREVFHTKGDFTLPISATGMAGMESAFCNVIEPGDKLVVLVNGFFGTRMVDVGSWSCPDGALVTKCQIPAEEFNRNCEFFTTEYRTKRLDCHNG